MGKNKMGRRQDSDGLFGFCRFPLRLPFSKVFPTCCRDVSAFVHQFYQFAEGFSQTHGEMDDILKKVSTP
jgi:hypothetical protein